MVLAVVVAAVLTVLVLATLLTSTLGDNDTFLLPSAILVAWKVCQALAKRDTLEPTN